MNKNFINKSGELSKKNYQKKKNKTVFWKTK